MLQPLNRPDGSHSCGAELLVGRDILPAEGLDGMSLESCDSFVPRVTYAIRRLLSESGLQVVARWVTAPASTSHPPHEFERRQLADFSPSQTHGAGKPSSAAFGWWSRGIRPYQAFPLSKCSRRKKDGLRRHAPSVCLKYQAF